MNKAVTLAAYRDRIMSVVDFIWRNIERDIDVNTLADVAHFSPYHFHRIYREMMHENVSVTVRRLRLHKAACLLIRSELSIVDIAGQLGYGSGEAFSRAFTRLYEESPSEYRQKHRQFPTMDLTLPITQRNYPMEHSVEIIDLEAIECGGLPHKGDYLEIGAVFEKVYLSAGSKNLLNETTRSFGIYYDDPWSMTKDDLRSHACVSLKPEQSETAGLEPLQLGGGDHAVLTFTGPYSELEKAYEWFYGQWLPNSGRDLADAPPFEEYLNDPKQVAPTELITKIYLPLAA